MRISYAKRIVVILCAVALAALLPVVAFAADDTASDTSGENVESPTNKYIESTASVSYPGSPVQVSVYVEGEVTKADWEAWKLTTVGTDKVAEATSQMPANSQIVASFETYPELIHGDISVGEMWLRATQYSYLFIFDLNTNEYDGKTAYVYIDHHNGSIEVQSDVIEDGCITIFTELSLYTIVIDMDSGPQNQKSVDTGAVSPKTGAIGGSSTWVWAGALGAAALAGAVVLGVSLRRTSRTRKQSDACR